MSIENELIGIKKVHRYEFRRQGFFGEMLKNAQLYGMALPGILWFLVFSYIPLAWLIVAFKDYNIVDGVFGSPWRGLKNFEFYFKSQYFFSTTFNTLYLNLLFITSTLIVSVGLALLLNEVSNKQLKKVYQSSMFFPYFLSWIIISALLYNILGESYGAVNTLLKSLGLSPVAWYSEPSFWRVILVFVSTWQGAGYFIIIYLGTIVSIDPSLYEAAKIDGANKFHEITHVTMPHLIPTIVIMVLLQIGRIFYGNFQMIYSIIGDNGILLPVTEVIDTYVWRAMRVQGEYGMAAAIGLYQSLLGFCLVVLSNKLAKRYNDGAGLF